MLRIKILLASILLVFAGFGTFAAPAAQAHEDGSKGCVTWHEFGHADFNVYMQKVHEIFDTNGQLEEYWDRTGDYTRSYPSCADSTPRFCVDYWHGQSGADAAKVWDRYVGPCNDPEGDGAG